METKRMFAPTAGVLGVLAAAGVGAWVYQLTQGLGATGMNNVTSWGLYITCFMLFVGLSAGGLIVASSASVFGIKKFKAVSMPAVLLSTVCIVAAALFVCIDLGGVQRIFNLLLHPNPASPLLWDVVVISCYLIINLLYLFFMTRPEPDAAKIKVVSCFALPVAILVHSVTAWIFGLQIAKAGWFTAIMAPLFVASALDSGLALLLIVLVALNSLGVFRLDRSLMKSLAGLLATCIAVDAYLLGCEVLTMAYPGGAEGAYLMQLVTGPTAPFFWFEVVGGLLVPFLVLVFAKNRERTGLVVAASALVVAGVFCKRVWLLFTAFLTPNVEGSLGVTLGKNGLAGTDIWALGGTYVPTWVELLIVVGVLALVVLAFMLLARKFFASSK